MKLSKTLLPSLCLFVSWRSFVCSFVRLFVRSFVCLFGGTLIRSFVWSLFCLFGCSIVLSQRSQIFNFEDMSTGGKTTKRMINRTLARSGVRTYKHAVDQAHPRTHARTNERNARGSNFNKFWKNNYSFLKTIWGIKHKKASGITVKKILKIDHAAVAQANSWGLNYLCRIWQNMV